MSMYGNKKLQYCAVIICPLKLKKKKEIQLRENIEIPNSTDIF